MKLFKIHPIKPGTVKFHLLHGSWNSWYGSHKILVILAFVPCLRITLYRTQKDWTWVLDLYRYKVCCR